MADVVCLRLMQAFRRVSRGMRRWQDGAAPPVTAEIPAPASTAPAPPASVAPTTVSNVPTMSNTPAPTPAAPASAGPVGGGPGVGFGPTTSHGPTAGMSDWLYAVGLSGLAARSNASGRARRTSEQPVPDDADAPAEVAAAAAAKERTRSRRHRGGTIKDRAYRYEFMDLDSDPGPDESDAALIGQSDSDGGPLGFAGAAAKSGARRPSGLTTLAGDRLGDGPSLPMVPSSWDDATTN